MLQFTCKTPVFLSIPALTQNGCALSVRILSTFLYMNKVNSLFKLTVVDPTSRAVVVSNRRPKQ